MTVGIELSPIGLGCYALGGGYGAVDPAVARETMAAAIDAGWTLFDTAEAYLDSEVRIGEFLGPWREQVFLATKVFPMEPYTYANMRKALDNSLRKLRTDVIDLYQLHGPQDWVIPIEGAPAVDEIAESLRRLRDSGDVRHIGVCNFPMEVMIALHARVGLYSTQNLYSILDQESGEDDLHLPVQSDILPWAAANGVNFLAFSPLARGLLADALDPFRTFEPDDERSFLPRFQPDVYPDWARLANRLETWARDHGRTLVHLAVAWCLANPGVTSALVGAKSAAHVDKIAGAQSWKLTPANLQEIQSIVDSLPEPAARARSIVWDHFTADALQAMYERRHSN